MITGARGRVLGARVHTSSLDSHQWRGLCHKLCGLEPTLLRIMVGAACEVSTHIEAAAGQARK